MSSIGHIVLTNAQFEKSATDVKQFPDPYLPEIVFSGKSNVGKSSLINSLCGTGKLARISSTPGKTVYINFYNLKTMRLVDLPGYGYARVSKEVRSEWASLVDSYFNSNRNIKLVIQLMDIRIPPSENDIQMVEFLKAVKLPYILAFNKIDKLNKTEFESQKSNISNIFGQNNASLIFISASKKTNTGDLVRIIREKYKS
jgi:GTP-binding protein